MSASSLWERINVGLPELSYRERLSMEGKGSTKWAAHSHSPAGVILRTTRLPSCLGRDDPRLSTRSLNSSSLSWVSRFESMVGCKFFESGRATAFRNSFCRTWQKSELPGHLQLIINENELTINCSEKLLFSSTDRKDLLLLFASKGM